MPLLICAQRIKLYSALSKKLRDCLAIMLRFAFENKVQVSEKIVKATKVMHNGKEEPMRGPVYLGFPNKTDVKRIVKAYYLEEKR